MAYIKILKDNELVGGTDETDVYPITHTKAIFDSNNKELDQRLEENDDDMELLHRQSEKLVLSLTSNKSDDIEINKDCSKQEMISAIININKVLINSGLVK